ncbi:MULTISPECIES: TVP38/TMEM64 family protein [unclassified Cyanobium]|uniref:TVP38/TMEM64 family protein n=1 Tax=unclassified Cyanobium TaxID=2627006 RepID=UPI0020CBC9C2|nr:MULTISPECIES: VTT domain-containing protein [unclassified Cyanobium]MCP9860131.1 TVP38/TMEM64 family protein [Cyanobium sp. Cruz-8H5]MCP9867275.1 TVP38/TMEM64 family protein [Cyanobium sp. Cruz-8D1]
MDGSALLDQLLPALRSPLGALAFVPLYALWVTLLLPGVWASMLAGVLYGPVAGSVLVFAGACLGAQAVFLLGRGRWRGWARRRLARAPRLLAVERAVCRQGLALVLLTRLSPAFPFSLLNLAYGLSEVSLRDYSIGLIGILPGTVLFCSLGAAAGDPSRFAALLAGPSDGVTWALRLLGVVATLAAVLLVGRQVRLALEERGVASHVAMQASDGNGRDSP